MRLIDADALETKAKTIYMEHGNVAIPTRVIPISDLHLTPTIDAEPVVRCNICKYYETDVGFCNYHGHGMDWDGYCSRGAKMDLEVQDGT